jgi:large subunit ribosomal protein L10
MNREQKEAAVAELSGSLQEAEAIFAIDYRGISVSGAAELRSRLAEADAVFKVVKNRLARRAVTDAGAETIDEHLVGPTALTLIKGDAVIAAKAISTFAREHEVLEFKGGIMDGEPLDAEGFAAIARLPGLEVLRGQLVGVAASPITGLVRGLGSMLSGLAVALGQIQERGLVGGEAVAEETRNEGAGGEAQAAEEDQKGEPAGEPEATDGDETSEEGGADGAEAASASEPEGEDEQRSSEDVAAEADASADSESED